MATKVALIINTCEAYYKKTLLQFFAHAKDTGIPFDQIYVVVGESADAKNEIEFQPHKPDEAETFDQGGFHIIHSPYVNIDYNAAVFFTQTPQGRAELEKYTHFFYIHDTADLMAHFWKRIQEYAAVCTDYVKLTQTHTKNIGLFSVPWFMENKTEFLKNIVNTDPQLKSAYKCGEFPNKTWLYANIPRLCPWNLGEDCLFDYDDATGKPLGEFFVNEPNFFFAEMYGSTEPRKIILFQEPGVVKYQKNWGQPGATWSTEL